MIVETAIPKRSERIAARVVEGKLLLVLIDQKQLHTLNQVGTRVWELCDGRNLTAIARSIVDEFEIDEATALRDVQRFVQELNRIGALTVDAA